MQVDLNSYSLDDIFKHLKFEDMKDKNRLYRLFQKVDS